MAAFHEIIQRDDGKWHDDAPGPFESRRFAEAIAGRHQPARAPRTKCRRIKIREVRRDASA
jgi:hypothetical protein